MEEVKMGDSWNKKKIIIAILLLISLMVGGYFLRSRVLSENSSQLDQSVEGVTTEETTKPASKINIQEVVKEKINTLQQEVSGLNVLEIASSSPQMQKIFNDIKSLEQYPTDQLKELCKKLCGL